ncbi:MAG: D-alanyl-D-alanine carboxypeptidase/D-alanyl-D-alanine-endopeptidase [Thermoleophilia bacterium]|nr:D-alanyl-D-alanine carboxypeptidase/D-alanyl-D-alanine-endopeptidase [Thermoleophilia bacterium]
MADPTRNGRAGTVSTLRRVVNHPVRTAPASIVALVGLAISGAVASIGAGASNPVQAAVAGFARTHPTASVLVQRVTPAGPVTIASWRPSTALAPASTIKVITSAAALLTIGPTFRFATRVESAPGASVTAGAIDGPVYLIGAGDPMLSTRAYSRTNLHRLGTPIEELARSVRGSGIRIVQGGVVVDESLFDAKRTGPQWQSDYVFECPPLSAIATNGNRTDTGDNVESPAIAAGKQFVIALKRSGVQVGGPIRAGRAVPGGAIVGQVYSPPLASILEVMNSDSDNFIAEILMKDVGAYGTGHGTTDAGTRHAARVLRERGILTTADAFVDGSGLSHANRVSATTLVGVLAAADADPTWGDALIRSLPHGGEGTLIRRLRAASVRKRVRAKTGYIRGVASLTGTVTSFRGVPYVFAFLMNTTDITKAQATMDTAVTLLATGAADSSS